MRTDEIRRQNERYYFCHDYAWPVKIDRWMPFVLVSVMAAVSVWIRNLFMKQMYFKRAAETVLEDQDVMQWINDSMAGDHSMLLFIGSVNIAVAVLAFLCTTRVIKSYKVYKWRWLRVAPVLLYMGEVCIMWLYYKEAGAYLLIIALLLKLAPVFVSPRLLYPLETRPPAKGEVDLAAVIAFWDKIIFQKL